MQFALNPDDDEHIVGIEINRVVAVLAGTKPRISMQRLQQNWRSVQSDELTMLFRDDYRLF